MATYTNETVIDTTAPVQSSNSDKEFAKLPTDFYLMECTSATLEEDQYAEPNKDGTKPSKAVLVWEPYLYTDEQAEEISADDKFKVWQRVAPWYGFTKDGAPSKFKTLVDSMIAEGVLPARFVIGDLVGVVQRVSIEQYTKTMGPNKGKRDNKVISVGPLRTRDLKALERKGLHVRQHDLVDAQQQANANGTATPESGNIPF